MDERIIARLAALEADNRRLKRLVAGLGSALAVAGVVAGAWSCAGATKETTPVSLRVSELVVVDGQGVERVRIGGDLPDAVIQGKTVPRGEKVAGVMLYDDTGQERGGYVTFSPSGNVALTLDTRQGQVALFAADPVEGAALRLWTGRDEIALWADSDGARVSAVGAKKVLFQQPPAAPPEKSSTCTDLKALRGQHPAEVILGACQERRTEDWCRACLGGV